MSLATAAAPRARVDALAMAILVGLCALWGLQQVAIKLAVANGLPPLLQAGLRSLVAALCVAGWIGARQGRAGLAALLARDTLAPGLAVATLFAAEFLLLFPGLALTTASRGVVFLYTAPFWTALGAHILLPGERMSLRQLAGLLVAFAGVAATFAEGLLSGGGSLVGDLMCLAGGALWGISTVVVKASRPLARAHPSKLLFLQLAGSAPMLLLGAWAAGEHASVAAVAPIAWAGLFYQTIVVAFVSYLVWFRLIVAYPAGRIAGFTFLTPLFGILAGALLLGEHASPALLLGLLAIALGMRLLNGARR